MQTLKIVVVDDNVGLLKVLERFLTRLGHQVFTARSLEEGYQQGLKRQPALLITDYQMPDGTGLELIRKLECDEQEGLATTHYLLISGNSAAWLNTTETGGLPQEKLLGFLAKPFQLNELRAVIDTLAFGSINSSFPAPLTTPLVSIEAQA